MALSPKQNRFIAEYLVDANATQAAIRAGYSPKTAHAAGPRLLTNVGVAAALSEAMKRRSERVEVKADDILRELMRFAMVDIGRAYDANGRLLPIHEIPEDVRRAIAGIKVFEEWGSDGEGGKVPIGEVREVKFIDKVKGLELLGRHLKMFTDKLELSGDDSFAEMLKKARERAKR